MEPNKWRKEGAAEGRRRSGERLQSALTLRAEQGSVQPGGSALGEGCPFSHFNPRSSPASLGGALTVEFKVKARTDQMGVHSPGARWRGWMLYWGPREHPQGRRTSFLPQAVWAHRCPPGAGLGSVGLGSAGQGQGQGQGTGRRRTARPSRPRGVGSPRPRLPSASTKLFLFTMLSGAGPV